jgi:hypothetical protein
VKTHQKRKNNKTNKKPISEAKKAGRAFVNFAKRRFGIIVAILCFVVVVAGIDLGINAMASKDSAGAAGEPDYPSEDAPAAKEGRVWPEYARDPVSDFVDLTSLSGTMVYAEVYDIMAYPEEYTGKTIKMGGAYYSSYYDQTGRYSHYVIIEDALACCQQGLEFIWNGDHAYPDDYPAAQAKIEVVGVFGSYDELGQTYYRLEVDGISVKD